MAARCRCSAGTRPSTGATGGRALASSRSRPGAFADLTVREVVSPVRRVLPAPLPVDEVIDLVGLAAKRGKRARRLSGGQRRRLDMAIGIVGDPELLFLDEPTTGPRPGSPARSLGPGQALSERGKTTVLTTHYLEEAEVLADRVGVIIGGRMVDMGPPADLGGRSRIPAKVCFSQAGPLAGRSLPAAARRHPGRGLRRPRGAHGRAVPDRGHGRTAALGARVRCPRTPGLSIHRPTLEEIYLDLIRKHGQGRMSPVDEIGQLDPMERACHDQRSGHSRGGRRGAGQSAPAPAAPRARPLPGLVRATLARSAVELKSFFRNWQSLVFTLLFPVLLWSSSARFSAERCRAPAPATSRSSWPASSRPAS